MNESYFQKALNTQLHTAHGTWHAIVLLNCTRLSICLVIYAHWTSMFHVFFFSRFKVLFLLLFVFQNPIRIIYVFHATEDNKEKRKNPNFYASNWELMLKLSEKNEIISKLNLNWNRFEHISNYTFCQFVRQQYNCDQSIFIWSCIVSRIINFFIRNLNFGFCFVFSFLSSILCSTVV